MASLSQYFEGTASKYLSAVDATRASHQHEIGSNTFTRILGDPGLQKLRFEATFMLFTSDSTEPEIANDVVTFYDSRVGNPDRSPEYRLYYRDNLVTAQMLEGDFCVVAKRSTGHLLILISRPGSDHERRIRYLFDIPDALSKWAIGDSPKTDELDLASRGILDAIGIEIVDTSRVDLGLLFARFGKDFPKTQEFSLFARESVGNGVDPIGDPDLTLEEWMKQEESLFRALEGAIVEERLKRGFDSVEAFITYSLSVQNRRKSRAGHALENHLAAILVANSVRFERGARTEGNSKPDFLFPDGNAYRDPSITSPPLRMLAAKSTCKDRWRQVLAEAGRIPEKHLLTLETAISTSQTDEMASHRLRLVTPTSIARTYTPTQQAWLLKLKEFVDLVR